jgi:hypothetical protein
MRDHRRVAAAATCAAALLCAAAPARAAEALYAVTDGGTLVTVQSDSPGAARALVPISGLQEGESILAIDLRPKTGQLYALGSSSRIYLVNTASGAARPAGNPFSPALAGGNFGFDFNPAADRIRVVSDGRQNLRVNPDDGQVAAQDNALAYPDGDPGAGTTPSFSAAAYTTEGKLFVIDSTRDALTTTDAPNDGKLATVGPLGVDLLEPVSFDIAGDNRGWVSARRAGSSVSSLYSLDLATGKLLPAGVSPAFGSVLRGLAAAGAVPDDKGKPSLLTSIDRDQKLKSLNRAVGLEAACGEMCSITATLTRKGKTLARGTGALGGPGRLRIKMARTKLAAGKKAFTATLVVVATDAAGNSTRVKRTVRFT